MMDYNDVISFKREGKGSRKDHLLQCPTLKMDREERKIQGENYSCTDLYTFKVYVFKCIPHNEL